MSIPSSAIARIASGRTRVASVPALNAWKRSPPRWRSRPSAIWLRAELWVQTNRTRLRSSMLLLRVRRAESEPTAQPERDVDQGDQRRDLVPRPNHRRQRLAAGDP